MVQLVLHNLKVFYPLAGHDLSGNKAAELSLHT